MNWATLIAALLPSIFQFVETIHPSKPAPAAPKVSLGPSKMAAAVTLAQTALAMAVQVGAIPSATAPGPAPIQKLAQEQFNQLRAGGQI